MRYFCYFYDWGMDVFAVVLRPGSRLWLWRSLGSCARMCCIV